ncbi:hypothetical protein BB561_001152 [Smittium simulii]|uniref:DNA-directed RNA polymerase III subunit RPC10 n=1 Tax=Smittium simulii TaxID=133385 RepID=A0A2T9YVW9_9FUNG|nr:hypothetical protein BB561_001152 [Smittium simulii]
MLFCPSCCNLLLIKAEAGDNGESCFVCQTCPYMFPIHRPLVTRTVLKRKEVDDVLGGAEAWKNVDSTQATCPKCEHGRAYFMQIQIRSADEPMTTDFKKMDISLMEFGMFIKLANPDVSNMIEPFLNTGSDKNTGYSWDQFATDTVAAVDYVTNFIYAKKILNAAIVYDDILLDDELMAMTYKECNTASKTAVKFPTSTELNIKDLFDDSEKMLAAAVQNSISDNDNVAEKNTNINIKFKKPNEDTIILKKEDQTLIYSSDFDNEIDKIESIYTGKPPHFNLELIDKFASLKKAMMLKCNFN